MFSNKDQDRVNLKNVCVVQKGDKYYYPPTIPKERSHLSQEICLYVGLSLGIVDVILNVNNLPNILALYFFGILVSVSLQVLHRSILVLEEIKHFTSRYGDNMKHLIKNAYHFSIKIWIALAISVAYAVFYCSKYSVADLPINSRSLLCLVPSIYLISSFLELDTSPLNDSLWIAKDNGLDYGSGMAYSFFHGYLDLVLPKSGTAEKNLKELMQDYEDKNHVEFAAYKLFILIPKSLNCFVSLNRFSSVEESEPLADKIITVAGVKDRMYHNAVYKISAGNEDKKIYVSAEYATPLKTFLEVVKHAGLHRDYYDEHKNDIILQFYLTVKRVLEKTGLNEFCEPIFYEDKFQCVDADPYYDVGKIILQRLRQLKKNQREKSD